MLSVVDLPALAGVRWFTEAIRMYRAAPLPWSVLAAGWLGVMLFCFIVPVIGQLAIAALQPVLTAGVLLAAAQAAQGGGVPTNALFAGFKLPTLRQLILVGLLEATLATIVIAFLVQYLLGDVKLDPNLSASDPKTREIIVAAIQGKEWSLFVGVGLVVTIKGMFWFCVPLLTFNQEMRVSHALRWSMYAALSNVGAMVVYGVTMVVLMIVVMLPSALLSILSIVALAIGMPIVLLSNFMGYQSVFAHASPDNVA